MNHAQRGTLPGPEPGAHPDSLVSELLAMHEEMIVQLLLERLGVVGTADFLTSLIEQHQKAAGMLRARLSSREANAAPGLNSAARPALEEAFRPQFLPGSRPGKPGCSPHDGAVLTG